MTLKAIGDIELYRPMQYLGAKLRSLEGVGQAIGSLKTKPNEALDLFTGSSVVAQYMKKNGMKVVANDALKFCSTVAESTIGDVSYKKTPDQLLSMVGEVSSNTRAWELLGDYAAEEEKAIGRKAYKVLIEMYHILPKLLRDEENSSSRVHDEAGNCGFDRGDIFSSIYAGTYFGVNQAIDIDFIRVRIEKIRKERLITSSEEALMLTALISAVSKTVFSAGKHFAQPHLIREGKDLSFVSKRILEDRSILIFKEFESSLKALYELRKYDVSNGSSASNKTLEDILLEDDSNKYDLIYVDPPYTAQQYSRFYHIPEVLIDYRFPELKIVDGSYTRGLYPVDRFKSRFCSKRYAKDAFSDVFSLAAKNNSSLIISYSLSKSGVTGNDRMISLDELISKCEEYSGKKVKIVEFQHIYRQFNMSNKINKMKEDKEIQIVCERP